MHLREPWQRRLHLSRRGDASIAQRLERLAYPRLSCRCAKFREACWQNQRCTVAKIPPGVGPRFPQVVVLFGATGDLAHRKLLPGLFYLSSTGFIPGCRVVGVSLDEINADGFRDAARKALDEFSTRKVNDSDWQAFAQSLDYVPLSAGPEALKQAVQRAEGAIAGEAQRLHCLSVPPNA